MKLFYKDGSHVEVDINAEVLYILIRAVETGRAEAKVRAKQGWREFYVTLANADIHKTFSEALIDAFASEEEEMDLASPPKAVGIA